MAINFPTFWVFKGKKTLSDQFSILKHFHLKYFSKIVLGYVCKKTKAILS